VFETNPRAEDLQVLHAGPVDRAEYVYPSGLIDTLALSRLYEDGYSLVLPHAHSHFPPLGYLVRGLEAELGCRVQANVYLSPPGAAAFAPHYDAHDVVVLQAHGQKEWTLFECPEPVPATRHFDPDTHPAGDPLDTFTLSMGDTAYLPRGLMHHAAAAVDASLHITIGIHWVSVLEVLRAALDRAGADRPELRRALPHRWWADEAAQAEVAAEVAHRSAEAGDADLVARALDHLRKDLVSSRQPLVPGQLDQLRHLDRVGPTTVVAPRDPMIWDLRPDGDQIVLACFGSEIAFPASAAPALTQLLGGGSVGVRVNELAGPLDDEERAVLVRRLIREGVVAARW